MRLITSEYIPKWPLCEEVSCSEKTTCHYMYILRGYVHVQMVRFGQTLWLFWKSSVCVCAQLWYYPCSHIYFGVLYQDVSARVTCRMYISNGLCYDLIRNL